MGSKLNIILHILVHEPTQWHIQFIGGDGGDD